MYFFGRHLEVHIKYYAKTIQIIFETFLDLLNAELATNSIFLI